jgi:hypothetical protein
MAQPTKEQLEQQATEALDEAIRRLRLACDPTKPKPDCQTESGSRTLVLAWCRNAMTMAGYARGAHGERTQPPRGARGAR